MSFSLKGCRAKKFMEGVGEAEGSEETGPAQRPRNPISESSQRPMEGIIFIFLTFKV